MTTNEPTIVERAEQPYVAFRGTVPMQAVGQIADRIPEVIGWALGHGLALRGAPFLKFNVIDMERELEIEAGVPVAATGTELADGMIAGVLPAGRYARLTHVGHPTSLVGATETLLQWAAAKGLRWDSSDSPEGERWGCRLEVYETNPAEEPDMNRWETNLVFRLAD